MKAPYVLRHSALFLLCIGALARSPASTSASTNNEAGRYQLDNAFPFRPWAVARDWFLQSIWALPELDDASTAFRHRLPSTRQRSLQAQYGNDTVLRFTFDLPKEAASLTEACDTLFLDIWAAGENWVDVRISKDVIPSLLDLLPASLQQSHKPLLQTHDLLQAVEESYTDGTYNSLAESPQFAHSLRHAGQSQKNIFFEQYRPWSVIVPWMRLLESLFPSHTSLISIGKSYEGRDIYALRVGVLPTNTEKPLIRRKTILITGGTHAREWISTSTVTFIAYNLISTYGKSNKINAMLEQYDWVFVPTTNPDGYVYTWEYDRLWRKNRQDTSLRFCRGVDLDRSFDFMWDGQSTAGNPCSENYAGTGPFDGYESRQLAEWARNETEHGVDFVGILDMHSYSQQILFPYSFSCTNQPPNLEDLEELGEGLAKAIRQKGNAYNVVSACKGNVNTASSPRQKAFLETSGGSLLDYFYQTLGVKIAYQFKLRDLGSWGFLLPKEYIVPVGEEILDAVVYLGGHLASSMTKDAHMSQEQQVLADLAAAPV